MTTSFILTRRSCQLLLAAALATAGSAARARPPAIAGSALADTERPSSETTMDPADAVLSAWSLSGHSSNLASGASIAGRLRLPSGLQLGLGAGASALHTYYVAGYERSGGRAMSGRAWTQLPLGEHGPASFTYLHELSAHQIWLNETTPHGTRATRCAYESAVFAHLRRGPDHLLRVGPVLLLDMEVAPTFAPASLGQLIHVAHVLRVGRHLAINTELEAGGTFGFDGNNEKFLVRGGIELLARFGEGSASWLIF